MQQFAAVTNFLGVGSRPKRVLKAIFASIGIFVLFAVFGGLTGLSEPGAPSTIKNALRVAFLFAVISVWVHALKREKRSLVTFVPGVQQQLVTEGSKVESQRINDAWELQQLEQRVTELKASLVGLEGSSQRLKAFDAFAGGKLRCPRCWVLKGSIVDLIPNRDDDPGMVRCNRNGCGFKLQAP